MLFRKALLSQNGGMRMETNHRRRSDFHASMFRRAALDHDRQQPVLPGVDLPCASSFSSWLLIPAGCVSQVDNAREYGIIEPADFILCA